MPRQTIQKLTVNTGPMEVPTYRDPQNAERFEELLANFGHISEVRPRQPAAYVVYTDHQHEFGMAIVLGLGAFNVDLSGVEAAGTGSEGSGESG